MVLAPHFAPVREIWAIADRRGGFRVVTVFDVKSMDPSLPPGEEGDDEPDLHDLGGCEVGVELFP